MTLQNNTILITGGSSGIGLELARKLTELNNQIIICGRSQDKLDKAKQLIPGLEAFRCDLSQPGECKRLASLVKEKHPQCNILVNNAAIVHKTNFNDDESALDKAEAEISTNFLAPITLAKFFIPLLEKNPKPKLINVTTGLVYTPRAVYPIYNATKAALHSFTQALRSQMKNSSVAVIEVLFPAVDTPWHNGAPPKFAIKPKEAVAEMLDKIDTGETEIRIGKVKLLYGLSRIAPAFAFKKINQLDE